MNEKRITKLEIEKCVLLGLIYPTVDAEGHTAYKLTDKGKKILEEAEEEDE